MTEPSTPESASPLLVSVIIPTYNRERLLREAIESVWQQTLSPHLFELVIVDNCSTDGTEAMMAELQERSPCRLRYYRNATNLGCFASINRAVELAEAPIVASTDSDCRLAPDWLERGLAAFQQDEQIAFVSGLILDKPEQKVRFFSVRNGAKPGENPCYPSGNTFYRRDIYRSMGGMDMKLSFFEAGGWVQGCADTDLAWRMKERGHRYVCRDDVIAYHEVSQVGPFRWLTFHSRIFSLPMLLRRHPAMKKMMLAWGPFLMIDNALFYLAAAGLVAAFAHHPAWLILALPFLWRCSYVPGRAFTLGRVPITVGRVVFLSLRQAVICGSLLYGSARARTLVL